MPAPFTVKVCGIRSVADARMAVQAGADALGLNFVPGRARAIDLEMARAIAAAVGSAAALIGIVADADDALIRALAPLALDALQLHGHEPPSRCAELLGRGVSVYKAIAVETAADVRSASAYPGERVLFDAKTGGSGERFDWSWLAQADARPFWLAGGLSASNVAEAVQTSNAAGVDVASGVELSVGVKDAAKVAAFVQNARAAYAARLTRGKPPC